jgi:hypothetical protein
MRRQSRALALAVAPVALAALAALAAPPARAEATRVLRAEIPAGAKRFAVENLAGRMRIRAGDSDKTVVTATVYGETDALASKFRLENVGGADFPVLRVRYPEGVSSIRYRGPNTHDDHGFLNGLFDSFEGTYTYDGRRMRVHNQRSTLLYADVEVEVARGETDVEIRNLVGLLSAADISGKITIQVASSDIRLDRLKGRVRVEGSSGDIQADAIEGTWESEFSSGDIVLDRFRGDSATLHTTSGDVRVRTMDVGRLEMQSSSGDFKVQDCDAAEITAHTGSGDISFDSRGNRLAGVRVTTGSGDVVLRLPGEASFEAKATLSSGDMHVGFSDGTATTRHGEVVAYRRGSGQTRIDVETGSGNLTIEPR